MGQRLSHIDYAISQLMEFEKNEEDFIQHKQKKYIPIVIDFKNEPIRFMTDH